MRKILVIDDDESMRVIITAVLKEFDCRIFNADSGSEGIAVLEKEHPDIIISDLIMPGISGLDILKRAKEFDESIQIIILTAYDNMSSTIKAIQLGAFDYLSKPFDHEHFKHLVKRALSSKELKDKYTTEAPEAEKEYPDETNLIGNTTEMKEIYKSIGLVSINRVSVLIEGESGTGKELAARIIHHSGITKDFPFVAVNCSALTETLLESELFGHVKGAFTGAIRDKKGKFELAGNGTILLDEISEISPNIQVKLLRVIQEKEFERVGGETTISVNARIIAATNKNLEELVKQGKFREDLYYRLRVFTITMPPLRSRKEDIPQLVVHFLAKINNELHKNVHVIPYEVMEILQSYKWVGNVRELENILTQAVVLAKGNILEKEYLFLRSENGLARKVDLKTKLTLAEVERNHITEVLQSINWNKNQAAKILGISKSTLYKKIEEYGIERGNKT